METIRHSGILKFFWISLTFLIFNYSIDVPDFYGDDIAEDLSFNDIESVSELFLEVVLGIENAVPEHDEDDQDDKSGFSKKIDIPILQSILIEEKSHVTVIQTENDFSHFQFLFENAYLSGQIKPPQA